MKTNRKSVVKRLSESDTLKLVEIYRNSECLWNNECPNYKNKSKRNECYLRILKQFNFESIEGVRRKLKSIRDTFTAEKNKMIKSKKSGAAADEIYRTKLIWYDAAASFLLKGDSKNSGINLNEFQPIKVEKDPVTEIIFQDQKECKSCSQFTNRTTSAEPLETSQKIKDASPPKAKRRKLPKDALPEYISMALDKLDELKNSATQDEYFYFGQYIACQLRDLPKLCGLQLQADIQNLVMQQRLKL